MLKKQCTKCGEWKDLEDFHKRSSSKDGRATWCRVCYKEYRRVNRKRESARHRKYCKANYEKVCKWKLKWKQKNHDKLLKRYKEYRRVNRKRDVEINRKYRQANWDNILNYHKQNRIHLKDPYVRQQLSIQLNIKGADLTPEMIQAKRKQLLFYRELKQLKRRINDGIIN